MIVPLDTQELTQTANIYKLISLLYGSPSDAMEEALFLLKETLTDIRFDLVPLVSEMERFFVGNTNYEELKFEHARLFVGPFDLLAPPYGSIYLDGQRRVMGDSSVEVLQAYQEAGLKLSNEFKQPPDHIVTELEFVYFLIAKYLETKDSQWLTRRDDFLDRYLKPWMKDFANRIASNSQSTFYKGLAHLTLELVNK
ncbi:putative component of anaerobic dehydrogenase [Desulfitobacterium dichloroeliminans LMG P-21439]|uniref:Putative component of anaerobic dehydrogenase n=1 Tax=Desulfitobacterium dichloroeliminans (strain LMG P-21439 / DCA1) TaxID=871963 RepID=L0F3V0_DESDL|nr:molecular chaperone TorD family protein [Desulfitobacterium dichloroeliminans]AGA68494.1 putative component of anaerobic dehydrogenase [Desulfitobacterium dichloroeliminans LMG P-21439]